MLDWVNRLKKEATERKSYQAIVYCFAFLSGIISHGFFDEKFGVFWLYNALLVLAAIGIILWKNKKARLILLGAFFCLAGFFRFDLSVLKNDYKDFFNRNIGIIGVIVEEPINKIDRQQLIIKPDNIGYLVPDSERILVTTGIYPKYFYGQKISFSCKILEPKKIDDFDYAKYLSVQNIGAQCFYPDIRVAGEAGSVFFKNIFAAKNFLTVKINSFLHEPQASFLSGLLLGAKNSIPSGLLNNFQRTGTMHIIAISGWNITFLGSMFLPFLFLLHLRRRQAFYAMLAVIAVFVVFVGAGASVLRAGIMGSLALYATAFGRRNHAGRALLYSAVIMFLINPRIVYDTGFWLSVAATFGLIYFSPVVENFFGKGRKSGIKFLRETAGQTVSAVIFTLPVSLYVFGGISLWSLPANIFILPFVALVIWLSLVALSLAIFFPHLSGWLFLAPAAVLNYITGVINFFGRLPFGFLSFRINFLAMAAIYVALVFYILKKFKEEKENGF